MVSRSEHEANDFVVSAEVNHIFASLDIDGSESVSSGFFLDFLSRQGLLKTDIRLEGMVKYLGELNALECDRDLTIEEFAKALDSCSTLVHRAVAGKLRVPDFSGVADIIKEVFEEVEPNRSGANATYIP
jgi:Ca2+-binding EF-hand superfamily protein